jgi:streptogramin lyase
MGFKERRALGVICSLGFTMSLVYVASAAAAASTITEFPVPTAISQPNGIAAGPDGNLWFTETNGNKIGRITTSGAITEFGVPTSNSGPYGIANGSDGNVWFTESSGNKIGRITTSGAISEFTIPTSSSFAYGIAAGPDGNLWFTENSGKIGRITTSGAINEFALSAFGLAGNPFGIASGPDGNLWFTDTSNKVGRITTSGAIAEFPVPTANSKPYGIAAGPDGNLWFTELLGNKIGRVTTSGSITEFAVPTSGSGPFAIANGPDGNLWFTESNGNQIGRITTLGVATEFAIPTATSNPGGIAAGPDGNLWFTEQNGNKVGRITTAAPPPPSAYTAVTPTRLMDTRGSGGPLGPGGTRSLTVAGLSGVPANATSVVMNVTVTDTTAASWLAVYPGGSSLPLASNLNWVAGQTVPNLAEVPIGTGGAVTFYNSAGSTDVVADLEGYFAPPSGTAGGEVALTPARLADHQSLGPGASLNLTVRGAGGVPASGVSAAILNVTASEVTAYSYLTVWPQCSSRPVASNLNMQPMQTVPNRVIVPVCSSGQISIYNAFGNVNVTVDVDGYFTDSTATGKFFTPQNPIRIMDTRTSGQTLGPGGALTLQVGGATGVPATASAVILNVTVTNTTAPSYLTVYPCATRPTTSDLNWVGGQTVPNLTVATLSSVGAVCFYNAFGSTDVVVDLFGYFN